MLLKREILIMVKHIILWTLKEMSDEEKANVKAGIKAGLEGLKGKIPGLVDIKVNADGRLASSAADLMLDSKVRPYTASRACLDFEI